MKTENNTYGEDDIFINFRDMLLYILLRWRSILVGMLIIGILAGGGKYLLDQRSFRAAQSGVAQIELEDEELAQAAMVIGYRRNSLSLEKYISSSLYMAINAGAIPTENLSYIVTGSNAYVTATLYQKRAGDQALFDQICEALGVNGADAYVSELIRSKVEYDTDTPSPAGAVLLNLTVIAPEEEQCHTITRLLTAYLESIRGEVTASMGEHTCRLAGTGYTLVNDYSLKNSQQNTIDTYKQRRTNYEAGLSELSANGKAYVERYFKDAEAPAIRPGISKKIIVVGLFGGVVLMVLVYALGYVLDKHAKSRDDLHARFGLYVFGTLCLPHGKKQGRIDRWLTRKICRTEIPTDAESARFGALVRQQLMPILSEEGATVTVTGSALTEQDIAGLGALRDTFKGDGDRVRIVPSPLHDPAAMEELQRGTAVVLAEKINTSEYADIYRELELCRRADRPVAGVIVLR